MLVVTSEMLSQYSIHPGEFLEEELDERDIDYKEFSETLNIPFSKLINVLGQKEDIDLSLAEKLHHHLGISVEYWMNLQKHYHDSKTTRT